VEESVEDGGAEKMAESIVDINMYMEYIGRRRGGGECLPWFSFHKLDQPITFNSPVGPNFTRGATSRPSLPQQ
jgi:hypothetical protein